VPGRLEAMASQLNARLGRAEPLPINFVGWLSRNFSGSEEGPSGNIYFLEVGRRDYTVGSMGLDGIQGTEDDITVVTPMPGGR